jgi:hypothetical protein
LTNANLNIDDDPLAIHGPGVLSYFELQKQLIRTFCIISLVAIPMTLIYWNFGGMAILGDD